MSALLTRRFAVFHSWYWLLVPLLAVLAYASVVRIGWLLDDFLIVRVAQRDGIDFRAWLPAITGIYLSTARSASW
jgi:hypothetical protein